MVGFVCSQFFPVKVGTLYYKTVTRPFAAFSKLTIRADDSYEISYLIFLKIGEDVAKFVVVVIGPLRVKSKPYNISCNY